MIETKSNRPLAVYRRPRGAVESTDSLRDRLEEALRVNDQLAREIAAMSTDAHLLHIRTYWVSTDSHITIGELERTLGTMRDAGILRPRVRPLMENDRLIGFELVAAVAPVSSSPIAAAQPQ